MLHRASLPKERFTPHRRRCIADAGISGEYAREHHENIFESALRRGTISLEFVGPDLVTTPPGCTKEDAMSIRW